MRAGSSAGGGGSGSTPIGLLERTQALAARCERPELERPLAAPRERLARPAVRVVVAGQAGKGKSALVNVLVGAPVCGVAGDTVPIGPAGLSTPVPTLVRGGPAPFAPLVRAPPGAAEAGPADPAAGARTAVPVDTLVPPAARARHGP